MQLMDFKIRCSAIGKIMTNPRSKGETLSKTCESYLQEWVKEQIYQTKKTIKSKYLTKGIDVEFETIQYYAEERGLGFVLPNRDHYMNTFITGTPDLVHSDVVYEFKSSWDCFTFPLFEDQIDRDYYAQLQGYMALTGLKKGVLVYGLINTPDELEWDETVDYSNIASKYRIKEFLIDYDPDFISGLHQRVIDCRNYINQITKNL